MKRPADLNSVNLVRISSMVLKSMVPILVTKKSMHHLNPKSHRSKMSLIRSVFSPNMVKARCQSENTSRGLGLDGILAFGLTKL